MSSRRYLRRLYYNHGFHGFPSPIDLFLSLVLLADFVYFVFPIYSHFFGLFRDTDDGSQELGPKRMDFSKYLMASYKKMDCLKFWNRQ